MEFYLNSRNSIILSEEEFNYLSENMSKESPESMQLFVWKLQRVLRKVYSKKVPFDILSSKVILLFNKYGIEIPPESIGKAHEFLKPVNKEIIDNVNILMLFYEKSLSCRRASELLNVVKEYFIEEKTNKQKMEWKGLLEKTKKCLKRKNIVNYEKSYEEQVLQKYLVRFLGKTKTSPEQLDNRCNIAIQIINNSLCHLESSSPAPPQFVDPGSRPRSVLVQKLDEISSYDNAVNQEDPSE